MQRRSTARNAPRKRYTVDAFEGIPELEGVAEDDEVPGAGADSGDSDVEIAGLEHESEDDEVYPSDDEGADESAYGSEANSANDPPDDLIIDTVDGGRKPAQQRRASTFVELKEGPGVIEARRRWAKDRTFPTRDEGSTKLSIHNRPFSQTIGGFHHSFSQNDEAREEEARAGWDWYLEKGGKEIFRDRQSLHSLTADEAEQYLGSREPRSFVMGSHGDQKLFNLRAGESVALSEAWPTPANESEASSRGRPGFVLNLGARAGGLRWIPGHRDKMQYLTTWTSRKSKPPIKSTIDSEPENRSAICIWRLCGDAKGYIDVGIKPVIKMVLCIEWAVQAAEWCPTPLHQSRNLGLLAIVTADGTLKILDMPIPSDDDSIVRLLVKEAAISFEPADTTCTCAAWLSPSRVTAGCADGSAHAWDLSESAAAETSTGSGRSIRMSNTYVQSITSCGPAHAAHLLTSSANGTLTVVDLDADEPTPSPATVNANKPRNTLTQPLLLWHDYSERTLASDDNCEVLLRPLRKRKRLQQPPVARARSAITSMAGSICHPCILVGTAGGEVFATNPVLKIPTDQQSPWWQQTWFAHEWRRPTAAEREAQNNAVSVEDTDNAGQPVIGKHGLSRMLDDSGAEQVRPDTKGKAPAATAKGAYTIYEGETAVTALAWNPNLKYGGWAAAAMADGLVRVEDVAR